MEERQNLDVKVLIEKEAIDSMLKDKDDGCYMSLTLRRLNFFINWYFLLVVKGRWVLGKNG